MEISDSNLVEQLLFENLSLTKQYQNHRKTYKFNNKIEQLQQYSDFINTPLWTFPSLMKIFMPIF
jgi:hypothetical protein